jgi:polyphenol oxidase
MPEQTENDETGSGPECSPRFLGTFGFSMKPLPTAAEIPLYRFKKLESLPGMTHFVTTRRGGTSLPPYDSLNLGMHTADDPLHVMENRRQLATAIGIPAERFLWASQVHSGDVLAVTADGISRGILNENPQTDALMTDVQGICLMVMVADCVPVLLYDPVKRAVAAIHAGWRGTVKMITASAIQAMKDRYGSDPSDILAGIGPSIGPCCYEVGDDVVAAVGDVFGTTEGFIQRDGGSKARFDLWYANRQQLTAAGIPNQNIDLASVCTLCHPEIYFSSRASAGITGRFAAGIALTDSL